jgi:hypothetical protein
MDIIITIPKNIKWLDWKKECDEVENNPNMQLNFRLPRLPTKTKPGDKCYVLHNGYIKGFHIIHDLKFQKSFICKTTGQHWPEGNYIIRKGKFTLVE